MLHIWAYIELIVNALLLCAGILYYLMPSIIISSKVIDYGYFISIILSMILAFDAGRLVNKNTESGNRMNLIYYGYYIFVMFATMISLTGNFLLSVSYETAFLANIGYYLIIWVGYFGTIIFGMVVGYSVIYHADWSGLWKVNRQNQSWSGVSDSGRRAKSILIHIVRIMAIIPLIILIFFTIVLFNGKSTYIFGWIGVAVSQFAPYYTILGLSAMFILIKSINRANRKKLFYGVMIIGFVTSVLMITPLMLMPSAVKDAENNFADAFGDDWRESIDTKTEEWFLNDHYSLAQYYLGIQHNACIVKPDISYYNGTSGVDKGLELYFDAYMPENQGIGMPGNNATIIRIHGGAWAIGDKGLGNVLQMNKYLAAQGYIVFDIQYGLTNRTAFNLPFGTPENVVGNFTIDDMLRHIGIFTQYITANAGKYGADLSSTFISGGSAGGQLTCATALAIANGSYTSIFGSGLTIKGYIPYYPALLIGDIGDFLEGQPEFLDPRALIEEDSPPCLVFQGTQDGLVDPEIPQLVKAKYTAENNNACAVLEMPLGGHGADIYFSGFYGTTFLYYMERFLYLYR